MKTNFTKSTTHFGCYEKSQVEAANLQEIFTIEDVLNADVRLKDKGWFIANRCELTGIELREFAIGCALCVLPIYESKYPDNKAPRKTIEAAQAYLKNEIGLDELIITRRAAADAAAYTAYAAADAADAAAYTAYAAADAAAYAADAAADAAAYTADAAADAAAYAADAAAYAAAYAADAAAYAAAYAADVNYNVLLLAFFREFTTVTVTP